MLIFTIYFVLPQKNLGYTVCEMIVWFVKTRSNKVFLFQKQNKKRDQVSLIHLELQDNQIKT